jgi:hypothetical protein
VAALTFAVPGPVCAQAAAALPLELATGRSSFVFASAVEGQAAAGNLDLYLERVGALERSAKRGTPQPVSREQYAAWLQSEVREWDAASRAAVEGAAQALLPVLRGLDLPLPSRVLLVRMAPGHMADAAYTRANAIYLPDNFLRAPQPVVTRFLAHELFHVASRHDAAWRARMYGLIGARVVQEVRLPAPLAERRITNPDAPVLDAVHSVTLDGRPAWVVPVLQLAAGSEAQFGQAPFFAFLRLAYAEVSVDAAGAATLAAPVTLRQVNELGGFFERIGRNTDYILHPEEILATNFSLLVVPERTVPTPQLLQALQAALRPR